MRALGRTASGDAIAVVRAAVSVIGCRVVPDMRVVAMRIVLRQEHLRSDKMLTRCEGRGSIRFHANRAGVSCC